MPVISGPPDPSPSNPSAGSLVIPTIDDLLDYMQEDDDDVVGEWGDQLLRQAADLFIVATSVTDEPTDTFSVRMKNNAICSLAHWLLVTNDDRDAQYSPFTSERIGSYSYSKAMQSVTSRQPVGVLWFDTAVQWFISQQDELEWSTSENVFATSYREFIDTELPDWKTYQHDLYGR